VKRGPKQTTEDLRYRGLDVPDGAVGWVVNAEAEVARDVLEVRYKDGRTFTARKNLVRGNWYLVAR
jgi:hypothetical protein